MIGRERFGLIFVLAGFAMIIAFIAIDMLVVTDRDILGDVFYLPLLFFSISIVFGVLIMKGVVFGHMKTNAEVETARGRRL
jgi:hypothetical protein